MKSTYFIRVSDIRIAILDNCDYYNLGRIITRINVPQEYRRQGVGSNLLKMVCEDADKEKIRLFLEIFPSGEATYEVLEHWYLKYGFKHFNGLYLRVPRVSQNL